MADQEFRIKKGIRVQDALVINDQGNIAHADRLPEIPMSKIANLQQSLSSIEQSVTAISNTATTASSGLEAKANATHTHAISDVTGLQTALDAKVDEVEGKGLSTEDYTSTEKSKLAGIEAGAEVNTVNSVAGKTGTVTLAKADVGLGNVDNTSDLNKPISTATQTALDLKAPLASPELSGVPTAPTANAGTNTTQLATTAFVQTAVSGLVDTAPETLDTLNELAAALGDDPNFATTVSNQIGAKLDSSAYTASDVLTKIKTVDGAASGLDADLLDGQHANAFAAASHSHAISDVTGLQTALDGKAATSHTHSAGDIVSGVLSADRLNRPSAGNWWNNGFVQVMTDGVVEVGKYFDFHATSATTSDYDYRLTATTGGLTGSGSFSASIFYDSNNTDYYVDPASTAVAVNVQGAVRWGSSAKNNGNPRSARIGYSGGNFGGISYGIDYTETSGVHTYAISDIVSRVELYDGIRVWSAPVGTVGSTVSWTEVLDARRNNSNMLFKGSVVLTASNYNSYSPTLTGTGASGTWGINITGNAGSVTNGVYTTGNQTITGLKIFENATPSTGTSAKHLELFSPEGAATDEVSLMFHQGNRWYHQIRSSGNGFQFTEGNTSSRVAIIANQLYGTIFYDTNNTGYYVDPASTSYVSGEFQVQQSGVNGFRIITPTGNQSLWVRAGYDSNGSPTPVSSPTNIQFQSSGSSGGSFTFVCGNDKALTIAGDYAQGAGSMRAPIFYDSNNTGYYVDPASTGDSLHCAGNISIQTSVGKIGFITNDAFTAYGSYSAAHYGFSWNGTANPVSLSGYYGVGVFSQGNERFRVGQAGDVTAFVDLRAPVFYDSNNTAYYCDPAERSNFVAVRTGASGQYNHFLSWTDLQGYHGLYSSVHNGAHFLPNNGSYGSWRIDGSRNGWAGIEFGSPLANGAVSLMVNPASDQTGFHNNSAGWQLYFANGGAYAGTGNYGGSATRILQENVWIGNKYFGSDGAIHGTVFYDANDAGYYVDPSSTGDSIRCAGNIVAYYSDERLKDIEQNIPDAINKVKSLDGFYYKPNAIAQKFGYKEKREVGVSAQSVEAILPEIVTEAPIGHGYKTVDYSKLVPLLVEAIKEQQTQIEALTSEINTLKEMIK
jgi:hypothetical protein